MGKTNSGSYVYGYPADGAEPTNGFSIKYNSTTKQWDLFDPTVGTAKSFLGASAAFSTRAIEFSAIPGGAISGGAEASTQQVTTNGFTLKRLRVAVVQNDMNAVSVVGLRVNGVTVASVNITAATLGRFDSGALNITVNPGDLINIISDTSASGVGTILRFGLLMDIVI